jgi:hypothetical protein
MVQLNFTSIHFNDISTYAQKACKFSRSVDYSQLLTCHTNSSLSASVCCLLSQHNEQQIARTAVCTTEQPVSEMRPEQMILN